MMSPYFSQTAPEPRLKATYSSIGCGYQSVRFWIIIDHSGILHLSFSNQSNRQAMDKLNRLIPEADFSSPAHVCTDVRNMVRQILDPKLPTPTPDFKDNLFLKNGTPFQQKVWRAISLIKPGETISYGELAVAAGSPGGARAAGHACHRNPLALIIPCHRIVAADGLGGFAGDMAIKRQLLAMEKSSAYLPNILLSDIECPIGNAQYK